MSKMLNQFCGGLEAIFYELEKVLEPKERKLHEEGKNAESRTAKLRLALQLAALHSTIVNNILNAQLLFRKFVLVQQRIYASERVRINRILPIDETTAGAVESSDVDEQVQRAMFGEALARWTTALDMGYEIDPTKILAEWTGEPTEAEPAAEPAAAEATEPDSPEPAEPGAQQPRLARTRDEVDAASA